MVVEESRKGSVDLTIFLRIRHKHLKISHNWYLTFDGPDPGDLFDGARERVSIKGT